MLEKNMGDIARALWKGVSTSDVETLARLSEPDIVWHASGRGARAGDFRGREAVLDYLARIGDDVDRWDVELDDVLVGDTHAVMLLRVTGERPAKSLSTGFVLIFRFSGERVAEVWSVARDQFDVDAFWS
jgi:ketosteroid isomerase-like protein